MSQQSAQAPVEARVEAPIKPHVAAPMAGAGEVAAPDLTLNETLRVLEVARNLRRQRSDAEVALARHEVRDMLRKRLLEAAAVTGDKVTERDVDVAIDQYFDRLYAYEEPPASLSVWMAKVYVRRNEIALLVGSIAAAVTAWIVFF